MKHLLGVISRIQASLARCGLFGAVALVCCGPPATSKGVPAEGIVIGAEHALVCADLPVSPFMSAFDIDGKHFVSVESDGTIVRCDLATRTVSPVAKVDLDRLPRLVAGKMLVSLEDGVLVLAGSPFNGVGKLIQPLEPATGRLRAPQRREMSRADPILLPGRTLVLAKRDPDWSNSESVELVDALELTSLGEFSPLDADALADGSDCSIVRLHGNSDGSRLYVFADIGATSRAYALSRTVDNKLSLIGTATLEASPGDVVFPRGSDEVLVVTQLLKTSELTWMAGNLSAVRTTVSIANHRPYQIVVAESNRAIVAGGRGDLILVDRDRGVMGFTTLTPEGLIMMYDHPQDAHIAIAMDGRVSVLRWRDERR